MELKKVSKSRACREFLKDCLADKKEYLAKDLKIYVQQKAVEKKIVNSEEEITSGIFSRACQDLLEKEHGKYIRDTDGFYKIVTGEIPHKSIEDISIKQGITKILEDTIKKLNKEVSKKSNLELTKEDFKSIQDIKSIITFLKEKISSL